MAYQINLTGQEIDERLQNVGTPEDVAAADGTLYARISKNADDIAENKENVKTLTKRVDAVTGTANGAEALAKANEKRLNTVTGTANTALKNSEVNQDSVRNAQITANEAKALVSNLKNVTDEIESNVTHLQELNVVYSNSIRNLTTESTSAEIFHAFVPKIGGSVGVINTPHVGYLIKGNKNGDDQDDPDSTIISVEIVKIDDKDCHKFMYIDNNRDLVTMTVYLNKVNNITGHKLIERSVVSNIDTVMTTLTEHDARQTNIEEVVSGAQKDAYFTLKWFNLVFSDSRFNGNIDNVKVRLYRWSGKRYAQFVMFTQNRTGVSQEPISYEIILKQEQADGANVRVPYIHYNDDGTEEELWLAVKDAFGGRISYNRNKKRRWRIQAFLNDKPITAPFDFRVSIDHGGFVSLTKGGMMRSVPSSDEVIYDGSYNGDKWRQSTKGHKIDFHFCDALGEKFPRPGDKVSERSGYGSCGSVVAVKEDSHFTSILWTEEGALYNIRAKFDDILGFICTSPAKKLCDNIYDYASKMNSGTLRDLYISAGAKYNETTGYYELNGLTDITEEEMRVIYDRTWGWWLHLPYLNGFGSAAPRTNIPCPNYKIIYYSSNTSLHSIFSISGKDDNIEVVNLRALYTPANLDVIRITSIDWAFQGTKKLREIQGIIDVSAAKNTLNIGGNIETINIKNLNTNIRFYNSQRLSKESVLYMINNSAATSAITIGLNKAVYDVMKDDADIIAALAEKTNITLVQNT